MEEKKIPDEGQKNQEEEYSFLQEVIKDETPDGRKKKRGLLHLIGQGFVLGLVACFSFFAVKPWVETKFGGEPTQVTIPSDKEGGAEEAEGAADSSVPGTENYHQMLQTLQDVAKESAKSVVEITGIRTQSDWTEELPDSEYSVAGVIVADNGQDLLILGKICPVKDAKTIRITFAGGARCEGTEKSRDGNLGLAVYAVPHTEITDEMWSKIDTAVLGNSTLTEVGDTVIVLGKPHGYANCYIYGSLSTEMMSKNFADGQYGVIHTDIAGAPDASGVIVNIRGEVIGMIDQTLLEEDGRNLLAGYSISDIKGVIELLSNGQGVPYLGINGIDVSGDMQKSGLPGGLYVKEVESDSPAMVAGIQNGDVITAVGDEAVTSLADYHSILMGKEQNSEIVLKGCRQGTGGEYVDIDFTVKVGQKK